MCKMYGIDSPKPWKSSRLFDYSRKVLRVSIKYYILLLQTSFGQMAVRAYVCVLNLCFLIVYALQDDR